MARKQNVCSFTSNFDDQLVINLPLMERKKLIKKCFAMENNKIAYSRYVEESGIQLFELVQKQRLEGVVAKRKESLYWFGKETKDWIKIKVMKDEDFVLCGYILKRVSLLLYLAFYR